MNGLKALILALATALIVSGPVSAQSNNDDASNNAAAQEITDKIEALTDTGVSLEEAIKQVVAGLAAGTDIANNADMIENIYAAVAMAVANTGIDRDSQKLSAAIAVTSGLMIETYGVSENTVVQAALAAQVDYFIIASTLPATVAGSTGSQTSATRGTISSNSGSSGGVIATPAT